MIERELIAAVMASPSVLWECQVSPEHFESEVHGEIWQTIQRLEHEGQAFDAVTVAQALPDHFDRIIEIANESIGVPASAPGYARKIVQGWRKRRASDIYAAADDRPIDDVIRDLMGLADETSRFECDIKQAIKWALNDMEEAQEAGGGLRGLPTGLTELDGVLGGFQDGDLTVIAARPAMGKTAMLLHNAASVGAAAGLISAEQPAYQIAQRHIASIGKASLTKMRTGDIGEKEMKAFIIAKAKLSHTYKILDRSNPSITEVERTVRKWHARDNIKILFVDYIQRIRGFGDKRHEQVGDVVRSLKTLARDLKIPVVALAQVSRDVEKRNNKRPGMSDVADSSEIEKEADQVITLYRDEVYDAESKDSGVAELCICKNRHGPTGTVLCGWVGEYTAFGDLSRYGI